MQQQFWVPDVRGTIPQEPLPDRSPASARTCQKPLYWFPIPGMDNALGQAYDLPTSSSPPMASHPTFDTTSTISSSPIKTSHRTRAGRGRGALLMTSLIQYTPNHHKPGPLVHNPAQQSNTSHIHPDRLHRPRSPAAKNHASCTV
jgi:hypothetical protein